MRKQLLLGLALIAAAPALADVKAGVDAWAKGDFKRAVDNWRGPAIAGDADAQFNLGQAYKLGRGVPVDPGLAESWFRRAALQGHEQAGDNYGLALFQEGRKAEALPWLEKSAARGEPRCQLVLGTMLFNGDGTPRDYPRAYALMTRASAAGLPSAAETLAQMDQYISPADRERGTKLAQQYAAQPMTRPAPAPGFGATELPPARAPEPAPPGRHGRGAPVATTYPPVPAPPMTLHAPPPVPRPAPAAHAAPAGGWRVQLGAFRDRGNAEALWARVGGKVGGTPAYVAAGSLTKLQATGFASKAQAQAACVKAGGGCVVVAR